MDFHYNSNINDFCRSMVKRDLERICNPQYNYRCGTEYKKHQRHVIHGELHKNFVKMI